jgi:hypothetical protein
VTLFTRGSVHFKPRQSPEKNALYIVAAEGLLNCISTKIPFGYTFMGVIFLYRYLYIGHSISADLVSDISVDLFKESKHIVSAAAELTDAVVMS